MHPVKKTATQPLHPSKIDFDQIRTVQDFVYVLRQAKPNQTVPVWIMRDGKKLKLEVTFGKSTRRGRR